MATLAGRGIGLVLWWEHEGSGALGGLLWRNDDRQDALNLVPLLYIGRKARVADGGALQDVAPTLLAIMGLSKPAAVTGRSLLEFE